MLGQREERTPRRKPCIPFEKDSPRTGCQVGPDGVGISTGGRMAFQEGEQNWQRPAGLKAAGCVKWPAMMTQEWVGQRSPDEARKPRG